MSCCKGGGVDGWVRRTVFALVRVVFPFELEQIAFFRVVQEGEFGQVVLDVLLVFLILRLCFGLSCLCG